MSLPLALTSAWMAYKDWKNEALMSFCAILALASMLAPLLVLQGLKNGITDSMRDRLLRDPTTLIITPKSDGGNYTQKFINELAALPGAAYAIGRTRETASDITLRHEQNHVSIALEPASDGEPVLARYGMPTPLDGKRPQLVLSATAASALNINTGEAATASLARRTPDGRLESTPMEFEITGILPVAAADRKIAFAPARLLDDIENYRDYIAVPQRGMSGHDAPAERKYASFRLYASDLDHVEPLAAALAMKNIETSTRARDIAAIRSLEASVNQIILIVSLAVGTGFAAFMLSSSESAIRRKKRILGLLRLFGLNRDSLILYPLTQTLLTAVCGFAVAFLLYFGVAWAIAASFPEQGAITCHLGPKDALAATGVVILISLLASARSAWQAANLQPSIVIRDI